MNITDKLTAALAFDEQATFDRLNDGTADVGDIDQALPWLQRENTRLAPLHLALVECVKALELTPCEFFGADESGSPIHAENCVKCEALARLAEVLK